jgi:hypothetical protein
MEPEEIKKTWHAYDNSLEKLWTLNLRCIEMVQTQKARSKLYPLAVFKTIAVVLGILYVLFLGVLVYGNHLKNIYFAVSIGMIMLITIITIVVYIKHLIIIRQINYSENIVDTQRKLSLLKSSTINIVRIAWLQLPFWSTWFWSSKWIIYSSVQFWLIPFPITLFFILLTIWLYRNISLKNMHRRWFKILFNNIEWTSVIKAMEFLDEIDEFKKG